MHNCIKYWLVLLLVFASGSIYAQKEGKAYIDSLLKELPKAKEDTNKINLLDTLSFCYYTSNPDEGIKYGNEGLSLAEKLRWEKGIAKSNLVLGINFMGKGNYPKALEFDLTSLTIYKKLGNKISTVKTLNIIAILYSAENNRSKELEYYEEGLKIAEEAGDKQMISAITCNMGGFYNDEGNYTKAFEYYSRSLKAAENNDNKQDIADILYYTGNVYNEESNYPKALEYYFEALKVEEEIGVYTSGVLMNIGNVYLKENNETKALEYYSKSLKVSEQAGNENDIAKNLNNIGLIYNKKNDFAHALEYLLKALKIDEKQGDKGDITKHLENIGRVYKNENNFSKALEYEYKALKIAEEIDSKGDIGQVWSVMGEAYLKIAKDTTGTIKTDSLIPAGRIANLRKSIDYFSKAVIISKQMAEWSNLMDFSLSLSEAQSLAGNYKDALQSYRQSISIKDSLFSIENNKKIATLEAKREAELDEKKIEVQNLQIVAAKNQRKYYIAGIGMLVLLSIGLFGRFRIVNRNKKQLEEKNRLIAAEKENADTQRLRAENSERVKQQFLANMSHEIRTPMNAVSGMTDLLIAKQPRPDQLNYLKVISKSSDILLHIINDILDLSKIEVGKMELENIDFSLAETIAQVRDTLSFRAEEKGLQLITTIDDKVNDILLGDPFRLNQILVNLGGNAIKFTQKGSVEIKVERISEEAGIEQLKFTVIDTGVGIPADKLQNLFESFKQVNRSDTRKYGGTGLGLSISKQLVELQGGNINVESIEGSGTVFSFILDYPAGSKEQLSNRILNEQKADGSMLNGLRILLADDNEYNRLVVAETLHLKAEVTIDEAINGLKAIQLMEKNDYDVVLMDVQMPEMNGFEATDYIRTKLPASKNQVPVIALTASMLRLDIEMCYQHGMNTFIPKPFKAWQLITAIAEQTGRKQATAQTAKEETQQGNAFVTGGITDLTYLTKFCEGDEERIKKYINIYLKAVPGFADKVQAATASKDLVEIAALMHNFKPKWMMMGMKQTMELGQKIELLCNDWGNERKISEYLALLMEQNELSVKELEKTLNA